MPEPDLAQKILTLKSQHTSATRLRAEAEASRKLAEQQREEVYARLKELGIDPDNAEQELQALEAQMELTISELSAGLTSEITQYNAILATSKAQSSGGKP